MWASFGRMAEKKHAPRDKPDIPMLASASQNQGERNDEKLTLGAVVVAVRRAERVRGLCGKHGSNQRRSPQGRDHQE